MEAAAVLRNSGNPVKLVFGRPKTRGAEDEENNAKSGEFHCFFTILITSFSFRLTSGDDEVVGEVSHLHDNSQPESEGEPSEGEPPEVTPSAAAEVRGEDDSELVRKWKNVMGPNYEIKVGKIFTKT